TLDKKKEEVIILPVKIINPVSSPEPKPIENKTKINSSAPALSTEPKPAENELGAPLISSNTHPSSTVWYKNNNPTFSWVLPSGTQSVGLAIDNNPDTVPDFVAKSIVASYHANNVIDGSWFLHVQFLLSKDWTKISHFRFNIDTTPPILTDVNIKDKEADIVLPQASLFNFFKSGDLIKENTADVNDSATTKKILAISASDGLSGLANYEVIINGRAPIVLAPGVKELPLDNLPLGSNEVEVKIYDIAGNYTSVVKKFNVSQDSAELYLNTLKELKRSQLQTILVIAVSLFILLWIIIRSAWRLFALSNYYQTIKKLKDNGVLKVRKRLVKPLDISVNILSNIQKKRPLTADEDKLLVLMVKVKNFYKEYFNSNPNLNISRAKRIIRPRVRKKAK
ncbi:MAG: hypothetical protein NTX66_02635, partial [Candidatus Falkowbacteria bacterium]|nr:hypothetical protein [Candidatus Falkowbacteria bacterium]